MLALVNQSTHWYSTGESNHMTDGASGNSSVSQETIGNLTLTDEVISSCSKLSSMHQTS